jgi:hypothetical protein
MDKRRHLAQSSATPAHEAGVPLYILISLTVDDSVRASANVEGHTRREAGPQSHSS